MIIFSTQQLHMSNLIEEKQTTVFSELWRSMLLPFLTDLNERGTRTSCLKNAALVGSPLREAPTITMKTVTPRRVKDSARYYYLSVRRKRSAIRFMCHAPKVLTHRVDIS